MGDEQTQICIATVLLGGGWVVHRTKYDPCWRLKVETEGGSGGSWKEMETQQTIHTIPNCGRETAYWSQVANWAEDIDTLFSSLLSAGAAYYGVTELLLAD